MDISKYEISPPGIRIIRPYLLWAIKWYTLKYFFPSFEKDLCVPFEFIHGCYLFCSEVVLIYCHIIDTGDGIADKPNEYSGLIHTHGRQL